MTTFLLQALLTYKKQTYTESKVNKSFKHLIYEFANLATLLKKEMKKEKAEQQIALQLIVITSYTVIIRTLEFRKEMRGKLKKLNDTLLYFN